MTINISIVNQSTLLTDTQVEAAIPALQSQITNDFAPIWGKDATLTFTGAYPDAGTWWLAILDSYSQASILGYHDLTTDGLPIGKVFVSNSNTAGVPWTHTASHELLEMLADPDINLSVLTNNSPYASPGDLVLFAYEVCDPVQDLAQAYTINSVTVCDFVYPSWFQSFWDPFATQFNKQNTVIIPFQLQSGGYIPTMDVTNPGSVGWQNLYGATLEPLNPQKSRGGRRLRKRNTWKKSTVNPRRNNP